MIHVVNPDAASAAKTLKATISSPLTSAADITKSGRGMLVLSGNNAAGGGANKTTLNEGTLEIADLDNIGGNSGLLVFAGGTLRLSFSPLYSGDDISQRTILLLDGGGTIDTNGSDLALANTVGSGVGGLTKIGAGNLTINAAATYTGATTVTAGTLTVGANNATGNGGALNIGGGATLALGTNSITAGLVSTSGASPAITGTGTINASTGFFFSNTGDITVDAILAGAGGLFKNQTNVLTLSGLSAYSGTTEIQSGTISFNSIANIGGGASALGAPSTVENGIIRMGLTTTATALTYTGSGHSSNRLVALQGTTGGVTINADGAGAVTFGGAQGEFAGAKTLTLAGTAVGGLNNGIGAIRDGAATIALLKTGVSTWELTATNSYSGATSINDGILRLLAPQTHAAALNFGSANSITTAGTLEVKENAAFGSLLVQTNSAINTNTLQIDGSKTLTINGNVTLGSGAATSTTLFDATGAGAFVVNNATPTGVTFLVGNSSSNIATADFSGLSTMTVSLNPSGGIFQVSSTSTTNSTGFGTLILADDTTVTASAITVGGAGSYGGSVGQVNALRLGSTANIFNVDTFNIGTGNRDFGSVVFDTATGTLTLRAADGVSRAAFNMGTTGGTTGVATAVGVQNTFDVTGHNADLLLGAVAIGTQATRGDTLTNIFSFDTGILDMTSLTMSVKTGTGLTGSKIVNSTVNLGGGTVNIGTIAQMGQTSTTGNIANATINISGGNVAIGTGSGTAITMASANTGTTANAAINLTGGNTTVTGNIVRTGGAGTTTAALTLDGGSLNMSGNSIGTGIAVVSFNAQAGTLSNLGQLNGGAALTKTTGGTLAIDGTNTYTGNTNVTDGKVVVAGSLVGSVDVAAGLTPATLASANNLTAQIANLNVGSDATGGGTVAPGDTGGPGITSVGRLNVDGNADFGVLATAGRARLFIEIGGAGTAANAGSTYDQVNVTGSSRTVSLNNVDLEGSLVNGLTPPLITATFDGGSGQFNLDGDKYFILTLADGVGSTLTGTFANEGLANASLPGFSTITLGGQLFAISYSADFATNAFTGGNDVALMAVPEPSSLAILAGSLGMALGLQRFRRRKR